MPRVRDGTHFLKLTRSPHFTDEETGPERWLDLPKVTQQVSGRELEAGFLDCRGVVVGITTAAG